MQRTSKALHQPGAHTRMTNGTGSVTIQEKKKGETGFGPANILIVISGIQVQRCLLSAIYSSHTTGYVQHTNLHFYIMIHRSSPATTLVLKGCDMSS